MSSRSLFCLSLFHSVLVCFGGVAAQAGTVYWDGPNTTANNLINGGTGTWGLTSSNWTNAGGSSNTVWVNDDDAIFTGSAGTVTLDGAVALGALTANSLTFRLGGYTITGGNDLTLTGTAGVTVNQGQATLSSVVAGTQGMVVNGPGLLRLTGANTFSGVLRLDDGFLSAGVNDAALGAGSVRLNGGTLIVADTAARSFGRNVSVTAGSALVLDRTVAGAGVTTSFGTLDLGSRLIVVGNGFSSGTAQLNFASTLVSANSVLDVFNRTTGTTAVSLGTLTGSANLVIGGAITNGNVTIGSGGSSSFSGALTKVGGGVLTMTDDMTGLTSFTIASATPGVGQPNVILSTGRLSALTTLTIRAGTLNLGDTTASPGLDRINNTANLVMSGGTISHNRITNPAVNNPEILNSLTLESGLSSFVAGVSGSGTNGILQFNGNLTRSLGAVLMDRTNNSSNIDFAIAPTLPNGILGGWAVRQTGTTFEWLTTTTSGSNQRLAPFTGYSHNTLDDGVTTANVRQSVDVTLTGNREVYSLKLDNPTSGTPAYSLQTVDLGGYGLTLGSGGLLAVPATAVANSINTYLIRNGTLTSGGTELFLNTATTNFSTNALLVAANVVGDGVSLVRSHGGGGVATPVFLSGINTYTGKTIINGGGTAWGYGRILFLTDKQLGAVPMSFTADAIQLNNATLVMAPGTPWSVDRNRGITLGAGGGEITFYNTLQQMRFIANPITGSGPLRFSTSANHISLTGANTYNGITDVALQNGSLSFQSIGNVGDSTPTSLGTPTTVANGLIRISGGNTRFMYVGTGSAETDRELELQLSPNNTSILGANGAGTITYNGTLWANATASIALNLVGAGRGIIHGNLVEIGNTAAPLTKGDSGIWRLTGSNTYSGVTSVGGNGALEFTTVGDVGAGPSSLGAPTTVANGRLTLSAGRLRFVGDVSQSTNREILLTGDGGIEASGISGATLTFRGGATISGAAARTLRLGGSGDGIFSGTGIITNGGAALSLTKFGPGTWTIATSAVNTPTGTLTLGGGNLVLDSSNLATPTNLLGTAMPLVFGGAVIEETGGASTILGGRLTLQGAAGQNVAQTFGAVTLTANTGSVLDLKGPSGGSVTLTTGNWTRGGGSTLDILRSGTTTINVGTATLTNGILPYATINGTEFAAVTGGAIVPYSGGYTALPNTGGTGTINYEVTGTHGYATGTINALKITPSGSGQALTLTGGLQLTSRALLFDGTSHAYTIEASGSGTLGTSGAELILHVAGANPLTITAPLNLTTGSFTKTGEGKLILGGIQNYGGTAANNGYFNLHRGEIELSSSTSLRPNTVFRIGEDGILSLAGFDGSVGYLSGAGTVRNNSANPATLIIDNSNRFNSNGSLGEWVYRGLIADGGVGTLSLLRFGGSSHQVLSGNNTFTGTVTIREGVLVVTRLDSAGVAQPLGMGTSAIELGGVNSTGILGLNSFNAATNRALHFAAGGSGGIDILGASGGGGGVITSIVNSNLNQGTPDGISNALATFSGAISGSGTIFKNGGGAVVLSGSSTHTGATYVHGGQLIFGASASAGTGGITLGLAGTIATRAPMNQAFLNRLTADSLGVAALDADSSAALNFTHLPGVSLGAVSQSLFRGTLTPNGTLYRLGGGGGTLTITGANVLTGANNVLISSGGTAGGQVVLADTQNFTGSLTVRGGTHIAGGGTPANNANGILVLAGGQAGTLTGVSAIHLQNAGILRIIGTSGNPDRLPNAAPITMGGGTLEFLTDGGNAAISETVGHTTLARGWNTFVGMNAPGTLANTLTFSNFTRTAGAVANFQTNGAISGTNNFEWKFTAGAPATGTIPWALFNGTAGFASYDGSKIVLTTMTTENTPANWTDAAADYTSLYTSGAAVGEDKVANTLRLTRSGTLNFNSGDTLTVRAIMNTEATVLGHVAGQGVLTAPNGQSELLLFSPINSRNLTVNANINDNDAPLTIVFSGLPPGTGTLGSNLILSGTGSNFSGGLVVNGGDVTFTTAAAAGSSSGSITLNAGRLQLNTGTLNHNILVNDDAAIGGGNSTAAIYGGNITLANQANLVVSGQFGGAINGQITGNGNLMIPLSNSIMALGGSVSNDYSGITTFNGASGGAHQGLVAQINLNKINATAIPGDLQIGRWTFYTHSAFAGARQEIVNITGTGGNQIADSSRITFEGGNSGDAGVLRLNGTNEKVAGLISTLAGDGIVENTHASVASILTLGPAADAYHNYSGILRNRALSGGGTLAVVIDGNTSGTQVFSAANSYTGGTTVTSGRLMINNPDGSGTGTGAVTTAAGSVLGGIGRIAPTGANQVTVNGILAPGDSTLNDGVGALTFAPTSGDVVLGSTAEIRLQLQSNGLNGLGATYHPDGTLDTITGTRTGGSDFIEFNGGAAANKFDLTALGTGKIKISFADNYIPMNLDLFHLLDWRNLTGVRDASAIAGLSTDLLDLPDLSSYNLLWDTSKWTSNGVLGMMVPEPSRVGLFALGLLTAILRRRRMG